MNRLIDERPESEKYENLGGVYFPILQQDGVTRVMVKIGNGKHRSQLHFLQYLRQHDRQLGKPL